MSRKALFSILIYVGGFFLSMLMFWLGGEDLLQRGIPLVRAIGISAVASGVCTLFCFSVLEEMGMD